MLLSKALLPIAVFETPIVFAAKALQPTAVLSIPVVLFNKALHPTLVLLAILPPPKPTLTLFTKISQLATSNFAEGDDVLIPTCPPQ